MKAFDKPNDRTTSGIRRWFQFRLRTLLCIMVLISFASSLWHPVIRPWLDSRQQSDEKIDIAALVQALKKRVSPSSAKEIVPRPYGDETGTSWLDSRQQSDEKIDIAALVQALKKRVSPSSAKMIVIRPYGDETGTSANANPSPNDRR